MNTAFRFPLTVVTFCIALIVLFAGLLWHIDLIEMPLQVLEKIEKSELDEIITLFLLVGLGFLCDRFVESRRTIARIEAERVEAIQDTMRSVRTTVDEFVAQMNLLRTDLRADAKKFGELEGFMFRQSVEELASKLNAIEGFRS